MKTSVKFALVILCSIAALALGIGLGSVWISPAEISGMLAEKLFGVQTDIEAAKQSIFWNIRMPRAFLAFIAGAGLAISGVIMQSILKNPLASSYTLGISSGAAVGASIATLGGLAFFGSFTVPFMGLAFGLATVFAAVALAAKIDKNLGNTTIILTGMAFSLFANAVITFLMALSREEAQKLIFWQLGSFALKSWSHPAMLFPVVAVGFLIVLVLSGEMDIMTFGEEQAKASGVNVRTVKLTLLSLGAILTGCIVSIVGIIGFIDLFTPHAARRIFGSKHRYVIPASALLGGMFMVVCDLLARTVVSPVELPIGAVTSAIGAPFFIYIYFSKRRV